MAFSEKQYVSIRDANSRQNLYDGSVRAGKTVSSILRWIKYVRFEKPDEGVLLMTGKTNKTLERNILKPIIDMVGNRNARYNRGTNEFHLYGELIDCIGANDERAEEKIRGSTVCGAYGDELTLWPESYYVMLLSRLSVRNAKFFGTTNPDGPRHWLKRNYLDRKHELNIAHFHFTLDDNAQNLDSEYVRSLKLEYTGLWYRRFIEGLWVLAEGVVYDMWNEEKHVKHKTHKDLEKFNRRFVSIDYGTNNPFSAGYFAHNDQLPAHLIKEYYYSGRATMKQKTDGEYADDLASWLKDDPKPTYVYVDPSASSFIAEMRKRHFNVVPAKNSVIDGIRFVSNALVEKLFTVEPGCTETINEFGSYMWDSKSCERGEDKPVKTDDHCMDMIRYGLFTHFFREFQSRLFGFNYN